MKNVIVKANDLFARLHAVFMEIVRLELERLKVGDISPSQYMILHHLGDDKLPIGDLSFRSHYVGTNISYNIKKMLENEYVLQSKALHDQRTHYISASSKGKILIGKIHAAFADHGNMLEQYGIQKQELMEALGFLSKIDDFWTYTLSHRYRLSLDDTGLSKK